MDSPESAATAAKLTRVIVYLLLGATGVTAVIAFSSRLDDQQFAELEASAQSLRAMALRPPPEPEVVEVMVLPTKADCDLIAPLPPPVVCPPPPPPPPPPPIDGQAESGFRDLGEGIERKDLELRCRSYLTFAPRGAVDTLFRPYGKE